MEIESTLNSNYTQIIRRSGVPISRENGVQLELVLPMIASGKRVLTIPGGVPINPGNLTRVVDGTNDFLPATKTRGALSPLEYT